MIYSEEMELELAKVVAANMPELASYGERGLLWDSIAASLRDTYQHDKDSGIGLLTGTKVQKKWAAYRESIIAKVADARRRRVEPSIDPELVEIVLDIQRKVERHSAGEAQKAQAAANKAERADFLRSHVLANIQAEDEDVREVEGSDEGETEFTEEFGEESERDSALVKEPKRKRARRAPRQMNPDLSNDEDVASLLVNSTKVEEARLRFEEREALQARKDKESEKKEREKERQEQRRVEEMKLELERWKFEQELQIRKDEAATQKMQAEAVLLEMKLRMAAFDSKREEGRN